MARTITIEARTVGEVVKRWLERMLILLPAFFVVVAATETAKQNAGWALVAYSTTALLWALFSQWSG